MSLIISILVFFVIILIIVLVHEFGHFFSAKKFGIRVDEFGFGFPPKIWGKKYGETEYTINALPFGGFVRIYGQGMDETEALKGNLNQETTKGEIDSERSFMNKPKWQQAIVLVAGIFANFMLAWVLFSIVFFSGSPLITDGIPVQAKEKMSETLLVTGVSKDGPADIAHIKVGDKITSIGTEKETILKPTLEQLISFSNKPGENVKISYIRKGEEMSATVVPKENPSLGRAFIGISPSVLMSGKFNFFESLKYGFETTVITARDTFSSFAKLFQGKEKAKQVTDSVIGPVGLVKITGIVFNVGIGYLISFMAVISVSLAVINIIPFPALDGGRLLFVLIEKIKGSRINEKFANFVNMGGFVILLILMLLVTFHDIFK